MTTRMHQESRSSLLTYFLKDFKKSLSLPWEPASVQSRQTKPYQPSIALMHVAFSPLLDSCEEPVTPA